MLRVPESPHCRATGPCGPCSELYYDFQPELGTAGASLEDDSRFIEFYNLVFMESNRGPDGSLKPLENRNIDTGMGLERVAQVHQTPETALMSVSLFTSRQSLQSVLHSPLRLSRLLIIC